MQPSLVSELRETQLLGPPEQKQEKNAAIDLLDALSQSGGISLDSVDLHIIVGWCVSLSLAISLAIVL